MLHSPEENVLFLKSRTNRRSHYRKNLPRHVTQSEGLKEHVSSTTPATSNRSNSSEKESATVLKRKKMKLTQCHEASRDQTEVTLRNVLVNV